MKQPFKTSTTFQLPMHCGYYVTVSINLSSVDRIALEEAEEQFNLVALLAEADPQLVDFFECEKLIEHLKKIF